PSQAVECSIVISAVTPTPVIPTPSTPGIPNGVSDVFDFEDGIDGWGTSEGAYKVAALNISEDVVYSGKQSMLLQTELISNAEDVYRHTEVTIYFNVVGLPQFNELGPYDLIGNRATCFI